MSIVKVTSDNVKAWAILCNELWPHHPSEEFLQAFNDGKYNNEYLYVTDDVPIAFMSLSLRHDYVEGKEDSNPVGYLEGIYVRPDFRRSGIAEELVDYAKQWALEQGCSMLASDCEIDNNDSRAFHNKIGFVEESVNVHFSMRLVDQ